MKVAITLLCEDGNRRTGLTSLFVEFIQRSLRFYPELEYLLYLDGDFDWPFEDERLELCKEFSGGSPTAKRLFNDHFLVGPDAAKRGAQALVTVGFVPVRTGGLPTIMHMLSLQHLSQDNQVGKLRSSYRAWAAKSGLSRADKVITNTHFAVSQILSVEPGVQGKLIQSYEGLQHDFYVEEQGPNEEAVLLEKFGVKPGYLYWCSNFYPYKQAEKFFAAYALLTAQERAELPVVMVGGSGWGDSLDQAMELTKTLGISESITRLGWVDDEDLAMLYRQARIFCLASREETFGRCVIESMACGTPCVVNDIPVMHEVTAGEAEIVDFTDSEASAAAFRRLLDDEVLYEKLRKGGLARSRDFDFDILARERVEAIQEVIAHNKEGKV